MGGNAWPALSVGKARRRLCEPGSLFEFGTLAAEAVRRRPA